MSQIHSFPSERVVLATLMSINPSKWADLWPALNQDMFLDTRHQDIFKAIATAYDAGIDPDETVILSKILAMPATEVNEKFICDLMASEIISLSSLQYHIDQITDAAIRRQMEAICQAGLASARDRKSGTPATESLHDMTYQLTSIVAGGKTNTHLSINDAGKKFLQKLEEKQDKKNQYTRGLRSGLIALDNKVMMEDGDLIIVGARPSMGKTTLMQNIISHNILHDENPTLVMSAEMPSESIYERLANAAGRINAQKTRTGDLDGEDWERLTKAMAMLNSRKMEINDKSGPTLSDVRNSALKLKARYGRVGAILVDYIQLMRQPGAENETQAISEISKGLKAIAKEFHCPVVALSQLNRSLENRPNKRPVMSDLRQSGGIEQDADVILFLYRDEVYNPETKDAGIAEIIIGKQRNGPTGIVRVASVLEYCQFANLDQSYQEDAA